MVVDASVWVDYLVPGAREDASRGLIDDPVNEPIVPDLVFLEVANACRRLVVSGLMEPDGLAAVVGDLLLAAPLSFSSRSLVEDAMVFVPEVTPYDAVYLALAAGRTCRLASFDRQLNRVAQRSGIATVFG